MNKTLKQKKHFAKEEWHLLCINDQLSTTVDRMKTKEIIITKLDFKFAVITSL